MKPSPYQQAIFDDIKKGILLEAYSLVIEAVAGSGKTTTIVKSLEQIPGSARVLFGAFNKHIATELQSRVPTNVTASTLNSIGWAMCKRMNPKVRLDANKTDGILKNVVNKPTYMKMRATVPRIVSLLKANCNREARPGDIRLIVDEHDMNVDNLDDTISVVGQVYELAIENTDVMDFDDQIFMPWYWNVTPVKVDWFFGDEAQDFSPVQIELVRKLSDRIVCVGDSRQAIYGFRGASVDAMAILKEKIVAHELPLSISYRCAKEVVRAAQQIVPHIEFADSAIEGKVDRIKALKLNLVSNDYVLCRTTAPLVSYALREIRNGKKATVLGRDIGKQLISMVNAIGNDRLTIEEYYKHLQAYHEEQTRKLTAQEASESRLLALNDRVETIKALMGACALTDKAQLVIAYKINLIFGDDPEKDSIIFSTVHKSKGLEADNVFIIAPHLLPHPSAKKEWQRHQEANLHYVAITRAKKQLTYVDE